MSTKIDIQPEQAFSEQYSEVLEKLYGKMENTATAAVAFAPSQRHNDLVVIPVANVGWRFGSGSGTRRQKEESQAQKGMGVGGTLSVSPVGFIEVKDGTARFRPIFTPDAILKMQIVGGLIALGMMRGFRSLIRRRSVRKSEKNRGSLVNVVFSPHTTILARGGQTRKPRKASRSRFGLNRKRIPAVPAKMFRSKRTR